MKHIKKHLVIYVIGIFVLVFSIIFPDLKIEVSGGFAWLTIFISWVVGAILIYTGILGGVVSFESKGLIPQFKSLIKRGDGK